MKTFVDSCSQTSKQSADVSCDVFIHALSVARNVTSLLDHIQQLRQNHDTLIVLATATTKEIERLRRMANEMAKVVESLALSDERSRHGQTFQQLYDNNPLYEQHVSYKNFETIISLCENSRYNKVVRNNTAPTSGFHQHQLTQNSMDKTITAKMDLQQRDKSDDTACSYNDKKRKDDNPCYLKRKSNQSQLTEKLLGLSDCATHLFNEHVNSEREFERWNLIHLKPDREAINKQQYIYGNQHEVKKCVTKDRIKLTKSKDAEFPKSVTKMTNPGYSAEPNMSESLTELTSSECLAELNNNHSADNHFFCGYSNDKTLDIGLAAHTRYKHKVDPPKYTEDDYFNSKILTARKELLEYHSNNNSEQLAASRIKERICDMENHSKDGNRDNYNEVIVARTQLNEGNCRMKEPFEKSLGLNKKQLYTRKTENNYYEKFSRPTIATVVEKKPKYCLTDNVNPYAEHTTLINDFKARKGTQLCLYEFGDGQEQRDQFPSNHHQSPSNNPYSAKNTSGKNQNSIGNGKDKICVNERNSFYLNKSTNHLHSLRQLVQPAYPHQNPDIAGVKTRDLQSRHYRVSAVTRNDSIPLNSLSVNRSLSVDSSESILSNYHNKPEKALFSDMNQQLLSASSSSDASHELMKAISDDNINHNAINFADSMCEINKENKFETVLSEKQTSLKKAKMAPFYDSYKVSNQRIY